MVTFKINKGEKMEEKEKRIEIVNLSHIKSIVVKQKKQDMAVVEIEWMVDENGHPLPEGQTCWEVLKLERDWMQV